MTIFWNHWSEKGSPSFKSSTNERPKVDFSNTSAVHFQRLSKSVLGSFLLPLWHPWCPKFPISFTNDSYLILVDNVRSKSLWFAISLDGHIIWRLFLNWYILDCSGSNFLYKCTPSVDQFSFSKSTSRHNSPPPLSIRMNTRTQFLHSCVKLSFPAILMRDLYICWTAETTRKIQTFCTILCSLLSVLNFV